MKYEVIRDTREQTGWWFPESDECAGTTVSKLDTGDYTIRGLENEFVIERKKNLAEFAQNIVESRFEREMERLAQFRDAFLLIDCSPSDIDIFPANSGIPRHLHSKSRISPNFILSKLRYYQNKFGVYIILTEGMGKTWAERLFREFSNGEGE
jgi:ERCC4-type nuclease